MTMGVVGRKAGMTRIFTEDGAYIPVTVIEVTPNRVTQVKTADNDGYRAVQVTCGTRRPSRVIRPATCGSVIRPVSRSGIVIVGFMWIGSATGR